MMGTDLPFSARQSRARQSSAKFYKLSHLRKLRGSEQVAAVCYRVSDGGIEFLLVQTRGGRWTFPKGGVEPGLTHAQAAALEAFEEAGVHGRMEEAPFARYVRARSEGNGKRNPSKQDDRRRTRRTGGESMVRAAGKELVVNAHLCEVLQLTRPQESGRNPRWFSVKKAKRYLTEKRSEDHAAELAGVVDRAVRRIERLAAETGIATHGARVPASQLAVSTRDPLHKVQFEAAQTGNFRGGMQEVAQALFAGVIRRERGGIRQSAAIELAVNAYLSRVLRPEMPGSADAVTTLSPRRTKRRLRESPAYEAQIPAALAQAPTRVPRLKGVDAANLADKVIVFGDHAVMKKGKRTK